MYLDKPVATNTAAISNTPKYLWFLMLTYSMTAFASGWFDPRQVKIFGLCTGAGSIAFPLTYLLTDVITEVYGYKNARRAVLAGLLFLSIFIFYGQFVIHFLSPLSPNKTTLPLFLHASNQIIVASLASYLVTETVNPFIVAKLKISFQGRFMAFRFIIATFAAYIVDELTYAPIAFYGVMNMHNFIFHVLDSWVFMISIELLLLPLSIRIAKYLKTVEKTDIYDDKTKFNIFSFNNFYRKSDNHYKN